MLNKKAILIIILTLLFVVGVLAGIVVVFKPFGDVGVGLNSLVSRESGGTVEYKEIISECRLLSTNSCISGYTESGMVKFNDENRTELFTQQDIITSVYPSYPKEKLISLYEQLTAVNRLGAPTSTLTDGREQLFYDAIIEVSLLAGLNPEMVFAVSQITTGAIEGDFSKYPSVLDLGQDSVEKEVFLLAKTLGLSRDKYVQFEEEADHTVLYDRFSKGSITSAQARSYLYLSSIIYLDAMTELYSDKPYYDNLTDLRFQNPDSFRNVYFRYAVSDPRQSSI